MNEEKDFNKIVINWYPGHMAKTKRLINESINLVDIVILLVDARIPKSSYIPDINDFTKNKEKIIVFSKYDLCDKEKTKKWEEYYMNLGYKVIMSSNKDNNIKTKIINEINDSMENINTKTILITGGTTFVSKYTAEYFVAKGNHVTVINRGTRKQVRGVTHINCDRTDLGDRLKGMHFDIVIDITAYTEEHIKKLLDSGVGFDDYFFISSSAVYPETNIQPFTEEQLCGRNSIWGDYGMNKIKAEQYLQTKVPHAFILRPPYFYGIYENLYREAFLFDCALRGRPFYIPQNGEMKLQFFNVYDLCRFIEILIEKHPGYRVFNVGNKDVVTVKEWVELCYKIAGKTAEFVSVSKDIPQRNYFCFYDYEYILDISRQNALMSDTVPLEQGLKKEFEWYRNNPDSVYNRKPFLEFIDNNLAKK